MTPSDQDFFMAAAFFFERERGVPLQPNDHDCIKAAGLASANAQEVAARIWAMLEENLAENYRSTAYWALGKRYWKEDKERLVSALKTEVGRSAIATYQIMIALENLNEPVFSPERRSRSVLEEAKNVADAKRYLASKNP